MQQTDVGRAQNAGGELSLIQSGLIVAVSLLIAAASWRFIEQPFRGRTSPINRKPLFVSAGAAVSAAILFGSVVTVEKGLPGRLPRAAQMIYRASYDVGRFTGQSCFIDAKGRGPSLSDIRAGTLCAMGAPDSQTSFLVWGDSHAAAMAPAIDVAARQSGHGGLLVGRGSCAPLLDFDFKQVSRLRTKECNEYNAAVVDLIAARHIPYVFMIALWPKFVHGGELPNEGVYFDPSHPPSLEDRSAPVAQSLDRTLAQLSRLGTQAILVMDVPEAGYNVPEALARAAARGSSIDISPSWASVARRQALARSVLNTSAAKYNATIIDPLPALCDDNRCYVERNGIILYHDTNHLSGTGAESISYIYDAFFKGLSDKGTVAHAQHDKRAGAEFGTSAIPGLRCFPQQFCQSQKTPQNAGSVHTAGKLIPPS